MPDASVDAATARGPRLRRVARDLSSLVALQGINQIIGVIAGFALLRWLDVESYAQYTLAFSFVATLSLLIDLGFSQSVLTVVGEDARDPDLVGRYVAAARRLRNFAVAVFVPLGAVVFFAFSARHGWPVPLLFGLYLSVAVTIVARSFEDFYALRLIIARRHADYLRPQVGASLVRLVVLAVLEVARALTAFTASVASILLAAMPALKYRREGGPIPLKRQRRYERDIIRYALPLAPMLVYTAFQSQIAVFVISIAGDTRSIADVGALARLGQVFLLASSVVGLFVAPRVAQADPRRLRRIIGIVLAASFALTVTLTAAAYLVPGAFVLLLGSHYDGLTEYVGYFLLASSVGFLGAVVYALNSARAYIYWWLSALLVVTVLGAQVGVALALRVTTLGDVIRFQLITNAVELVVAVIGLAYGLRRGPRPTRLSDASK